MHPPSFVREGRAKRYYRPFYILVQDNDNDDHDVFLLNRIIFKTTHVQLQSVARRLQSKMEIYSYASR